MVSYRPDLYGHVEASWRTKPPPDGMVADALRVTCPDCNVNVFVEETETDGDYKLRVAHDATCPELARKERAGEVG